MVRVYPTLKECGCGSYKVLAESFEDGMYYYCSECDAYEPVDDIKVLDEAYEELVKGNNYFGKGKI